MSSIESRIVTMKFDNAAFSKGVSSTLDLLAKLTAGISGLGKSKGISDLSTSAGKVDLTPIDTQVTGISNKLLALGTIAVTTLANITNRAVDAGLSLANSLSFEPINAGLKEYELNLNSIQTILANTSAAGTGLDDVNGALDELNRYADQTIYNFAEMARNIGTFTAAGVDLDTSVGSIKGIANLAALSGSSSQQAATAMYQLSQEISAGRVSLMGWNSVVNAGMGGSVFQRALAETAVAMGTINKDAVKLQGEMKNVTVDGLSFRDSIMAKPGEQSWLTSEVLTNTLQQFTGDLNEAELAAQGFNEAQIEAINEQAKMAVDAATKVKTLTQLIDVAKETAQSGWAETWRYIFGDFEEAKKSFTAASEAVNGMIDNMSDARNKILGNWKEMGGRTVLIQGITDVFKGLGDILKPIGRAFRDVFPPITAKRLFEITENFAKFAESLSISNKTARNLRSTFGGVFAIFSILGQVLGGVVDLFARLFGAVGDGSGGFLEFTGGVGESIKSFDKFLEKSGLVETFFKTLGDILALPIKLLSGLADIISDVFQGFDTAAIDKVSGALGAVESRLSPLESLASKISGLFQLLGSAISDAFEFIGDTLAGLGDLIAGAITPDTFGNSLDVINTALLGGIFLLIRRFFSGFDLDLGGSGFVESITGTFDALTDSLSTMQASVKANTLLKVAGALALITASLVVLSLIDGEKLAVALSGMAGGLIILQVSLVKLSTAISLLGTVKLPLITASMVALGGAILLMAFAIKLMATINFGDMLRGLVGIAAVLTIVSKALIPLAANAGGMIRASIAILILAGALAAMAGALKLMSMLSWEEMGKGLAGVAGSLVVLAGAMQLMPKGLVLQAAGILILSVALNAMGVALKVFATMSWEEIAKGLVVIAGALGIIAAAVSAMPATMIAQAAGLVVIGVALNIISVALKTMSSMSWEEIGKGMTVLAGAMIILAAGLSAMSGTAILGAAALLVAAAALTILTPVLIALGTLEWETIIKAMVTLAGVFVILGVAGYALAPVAPIIVLLGGAMILLGAGLALAGAGALAAATAFGIVVSTGAAGVQVLSQLIGTVIAAIPQAMKAFAKGVISFVQTISKSGPQFVTAMSRIISKMLDAVIRNVPKMGRAFLTMLNTALNVITKAQPRIVAAGFRLIIGFLQAIEKNIGRIVGLALRIVANFIRGIANNLGKVIQAGVRLVIKFIEGVSKAIRENSDQLGAAGADLGLAIIEGMARGISGAVGVIKDAAVGAAKSALGAAKDFLGVNSPSKTFRDEVGKPMSEGMAAGIDALSGEVSKSAVNVGKTALSTLKTAMGNVSKNLEVDKDFNPSITPVLDLSKLSREASAIGGMLGKNTLRTDVSLSRANTLAADISERQELLEGERAGRNDITFVQNNTSPKALSRVEIYRQTRNQISLAKEALQP